MAFRNIKGKFLGSKNEKQKKSSTYTAGSQTVKSFRKHYDLDENNKSSAKGLRDSNNETPFPTDKETPEKYTGSILVENEYRLIVSKEKEIKSMRKSSLSQTYFREGFSTHRSAEDILKELSKEMRTQRQPVTVPKSTDGQQSNKGGASEELQQQISLDTSSVSTEEKTPEATEHSNQNKLETDEKSSDLNSSFWDTEQNLNSGSSGLCVNVGSSEVSHSSPALLEHSEEHAGLYNLEPRSQHKDLELKPRREIPELDSKHDSEIFPRSKYSDITQTPSNSELDTRSTISEGSLKSKVEKLDFYEAGPSNSKPSLETSEPGPVNPVADEEKVKGALELQPAPASLCCSVF